MTDCDDDHKPGGMRRLCDIVERMPSTRKALRQQAAPSRVRIRLLTPMDITPDEDPRLAFHHTVLCQTSLPYRNPGDDVRVWNREQGMVSLRVEAGVVRDPATQAWRPVGLPWGVKPRLIMAHLNAEAMRQGSPVVEVEKSLSAFVQRILGYKNGRETNNFKEQLSRLSAALIRMAVDREDNHAVQFDTKVIAAFDLWKRKDDSEHILWPSVVKLSQEYFDSLREHAVPLHEADLSALAHSAMALDLYAWLAQRLHRINPNRACFIQWPALMKQFGTGYGRMEHFKDPFRAALRQVQERYTTARVEIDGRGMTLRHSPPPVAKRLIRPP
jgi:hypothetical protein